MGLIGRKKSDRSSKSDRNSSASAAAPAADSPEGSLTPSLQSSAASGSDLRAEVAALKAERDALQQQNASLKLESERVREENDALRGNVHLLKFKVSMPSRLGMSPHLLPVKCHSHLTHGGHAAG